MIRRKADKLISDFLLNDRRALLVTGARQVGKTFSIRKVGRECFNNVVEVNFIEHPDAADLFGNVHIKGNITYLPIYLITFLEQIQADENIFRFDLRGQNT